VASRLRGGRLSEQLGTGVLVAQHVPVTNSLHNKNNNNNNIVD